MNTVKQAIYQRLTGGTALTALLAGTTAVYDALAPQGAAFPYVVFNQQAVRSMTSISSVDQENWYYQIQAVGTGSLAQVWDIASQVDSLMQNMSVGTAGLAISGYRNLLQRRMERIEYVETDTAGGRYYHAGAVYRIWTSKL